MAVIFVRRVPLSVPAVQVDNGTFSLSSHTAHGLVARIVFGGDGQAVP